MAILRELKGQYLEISPHFMHVAVTLSNCVVRHSPKGSQPSYEERRLTDTCPQLTKE